MELWYDVDTRPGVLHNEPVHPGHRVWANNSFLKETKVTSILCADKQGKRVTICGEEERKNRISSSSCENHNTCV